MQLREADNAHGHLEREGGELIAAPTKKVLELENLLSLKIHGERVCEGKDVDNQSD